MPYFDGFTYRIKIPIPAEKVPADVLNPVVPIKLDATSLAALHEIMGADGTNRKKVAFADVDDKYHYAEIKNWSDGTFFVAPNTLSSAVDTIFYLYYGGQTSDTGYVGDAGDLAAQNVWSNGLNVYNFEQSPAGTLLDSLGNRNGTPTGMDAGDILTADFGQSYQFDGTNYIALGNDAIGIGGNFTIIIRYKAEATSAGHQRIMGKMTGLDGLLITHNTDNSNIDFAFYDGSTWRDVWQYTDIGAYNNYKTLVFTYNGSSIKIYVGGTELTTSNFPFSFTGSLNDLTQEFRLASSPFADAKLVGEINHISFYDAAKSSSWVSVFSKGMDSTLIDEFTIETADTIRELVITGIKSNLSNILTSNGYATSCGQTVLRSTDLGNYDGLPAISIDAGEDSNTFAQYQKDTLEMSVNIRAASTYEFKATDALNKQQAAIVSEQILGDIRKAMGQTLAKANIVTYVSGGPDGLPVERNNELAVIVSASFTISYYTLKNDPYNQ